MTTEPPEPRDDELLREFRELAIAIQRNPDQERSLILSWYERTLNEKGPRKAEIGMLLRNVLDAVELDRQLHSEVPEVHASSEKPLVLSLHGIRTRGTWQKQLSSALSREGFVYEPLDYGFLGAIQLILPFMRDRKKKWLLEQYENATKGYLNPPSVIAHSFGTYLVAGTLQKYDEVRFNRIIFCGSIVEIAYPWSAVLDRERATRVLNDCGGKDFWAKVAVWLVNDAGPSGSKGFGDGAGGRVVNRLRPEFRHSDFFYQTNYEQTWIPFLLGVDPDQLADAPRRPPNWKFRISLFLLMLVILMLGYLAYDRRQKVREFFHSFAHRPSPALTVNPRNSANDTVVELKAHIGELAVDFETKRFQSDAARARINEWAAKRAGEMLDIQDSELALSHKIVKYEYVTYAYMMAAFTDKAPRKKIEYAEASISNGQKAKKILRQAEMSTDAYVKSTLDWAKTVDDTEPRVDYLLAMDYCVKLNTEHNPGLRKKIGEILDGIPSSFNYGIPPAKDVDLRGCL